MRLPILIPVEAKEEHKCVVRLLTMALGMDADKAEHLVSPASQTKKARRQDDDEDADPLA